jgi:ABC-2 type transport system ATP-binding protein
MRVEARGVLKSFGRVQALRGVVLEVPSGGRVALIGPNGSGKSTLIRAMLGLIECEGTILLGGLSPWADRLETASRTGYVPQVAPQIAAPAGELVRAVCTVRGLDEADVVGIASRLGLDVPAIRKRPFRHLSGGMKQKLLIALALASKPELVVMDEPTASLDAETREAFFDLFEDVAGRSTLVLCSHRLEEIRHLVHDVVALNEGRVAHSGPAAAWLAGHAGAERVRC